MDSNQLMAARSFLSPFLESRNKIPCLPSSSIFFFIIFPIFISSFCSLSFPPALAHSHSHPFFVRHSQKINRNRSFSLLLFWFSSSLHLPPMILDDVVSGLSRSRSRALRRALYVHSQKASRAWLLLVVVSLDGFSGTWELISSSLLQSTHHDFCLCEVQRREVYELCEVWGCGGRARSSPIKCFTVSNSVLWFTFDFLISLGAGNVRCDLSFIGLRRNDPFLPIE